MFFSMHHFSFLHKLLLASLLVLALFGVGKSVSAATSTVCGSGCDFTTLTDAAASSTSGDVFAVGATYSAAAETYPIDGLTSKTIDCQSSGAVVSATDLTGDNRIVLSQNTIIRNCTFGNMHLYVNNYNPDGIQILNNIFSTTATSTIEYNGGMDNFTISDNQNIGSFYVLGSPTSVNTGLIENNTFYLKDNSAGFPFSFPTIAYNIRIIGNTFSSALTTAPVSSLLILQGESFTFASNTIQYLVNPPSGITNSIDIQTAGVTYFGGNKIESPPTRQSCSTAYFESPNTSTVRWIILHNTLKIQQDCTGGAGFYLYDGQEMNPDITIDFNYNLVYGSNANSATNTKAVVLSWGEVAHDFIFNNDYNAFYGVTNSLSITGLSSGLALGSNTFTSDPFLRLGNVSTADDFDLAPFSGYLDINGTEDIGAVAGTRSSTIHINAAGTINYTTVDATSTVGVGNALKSGDTIELSAGSYAPISVSSTVATTTIAITGVESGVIIDGNLSTQADGIQLTNVTSSSITNLTIRNASSTKAASYYIDLISGVYGGQTYDQNSPDLEIAASSTGIFAAGDAAMPTYAADGFEVTEHVEYSFTDWHLMLVDVGGGQRATLLVPGYSGGSAQDIEGAIGILPVAFATSTFIYNAVNGSYSFNQSALTDAGITLASWGSPTPELSLVVGARVSAIRLDNADGITITSVTSTNNGNGVSFGVGTASSTVVDSYFSGSTQYDINHESDSRNIFDNVTFTRTSSTFSGAGDLLVKFDARVRTTRIGSGAVIEDASVTSTDTSLTEVALGLTDASGYTSYVSLPGYVMSDGLISLTNGGFNPYTFEAASSTYVTSSTVQTLSAPNTTFSIAMLSSAGPSAPTGAAATSVTTSTADLGWTDNADDEDSFSVQYRKPLEGESYPGTATSVSGVASLDVTGLTPGEQYEFRVAALNTAATSTFATSSVFTMTANAAAPTLSALSATSLSITLDTDGNATSVRYALYSSTLGSYVDASGVANSTAVWQTSSTWSTLTVASLTCNTSYSFLAVALNTADTASTSTASSVTTSACPVVSNGGGGAIGGGGGGGAQPIFASTPAPSTETTQPVQPTQPTGPEIVDPLTLNQPVVEAAPAAKAQVTTLLTSLRLTTSANVLNRLALFVQEGTNPATRALGSGERLAVFKDAVETMGRVDVPTNDLERMAEGQIPKTRNLNIERALAPRALTTFKTMFGHAPNFKNATENLAWNTLMYRLRFPRDLKEETQGIQTFRTLFKRVPQDPFQWATVRVLGYVR